MNITEILQNANHCILGSQNKKLTIILKNDDKILITGRKTVKFVYELINGKVNSQ